MSSEEENNCLRLRFINNFVPVGKTTVFILKTIVYRSCEEAMNTAKNSSLGMDVRLARSTGRTGRDRMANARVTAEEQRELHSAARSQGKSLSEWARDVLLREARRSDDDAVFTEIVATRMLLVNLIKPLILGKPVTSQWITEAMSAVRREKRRAAQEVLQQYADDAKGGR
ncbi:plasmid mobilization protein [Telmatobacter bradus]|uniref:plasmid mobilization protein n=1 Tax=Telmatobacter bradus TaxID=474953 RepID=UPI003B43CCCD